MWLFLWVVIVLTATGFFLWSYHATYEQKRGWKKIAEKYGLAYSENKMMQTPSMNGVIKGHNINFYPQITVSSEGKRQVKNVIEIFLNTVPDVLCVVANNGFSDFVTALELPEPFQVEHVLWPKNMLSRTVDDALPELWFKAHHQRIEAVGKMSKMPFDVTFIADEEQSFVAIRTANSLSDPRKLDKLINALIMIVTALESVAPSTNSDDGDDGDSNSNRDDASA